MSKKEKREQRIRNNPANVSIVEFDALVNQYGHIEEGSKHPKAVIGKDVFPYQRTNPVRRPFVDYLLNIIDRLNLPKGDSHG
jgi:hypothetical protein